ncbi:hypothetical protein Ddep01_01880 [Deinococcus depolymerans]|uniref:phage tail protein n=1 Tax=Deinococcus depolymerans TaxID=392408 RepID=UPI00309A78A2
MFKPTASFNRGRPRVTATLSLGPLGAVSVSAGPTSPTVAPPPALHSHPREQGGSPQRSALAVLSNHRYQVSIDGLEFAAFSEVSGLQVETETMDFIEGGVNDRVLRLPVRSRVGNLILKRGLVAGNELLEWHLNIVQGYLDVRNVTVTVYNHPQAARAAGGHQPPLEAQVRMRFELLQAYPVKWSGPTFSGNGDAVSVETLELAHAGFLQTSR